MTNFKQYAIYINMSKTISMVLTPKQEEVYALEKSGIKISDIARQMKTSRQAIDQMRKRPAYKNALAHGIIAEAQTHRKLEKTPKFFQQIIKEEVKKQLDPVIQLFKENALPLAEELVRLGTEAKSEETKRGAINDSLNYAGYVPEKKVITRSIEISPEDAEKLSQAIKYKETLTLESIL